VGVNDFGLFFKVEGLFVILSKGASFLWELLFVVGDCHRGVRVSNEVVHASYFLAVLVVSNWQLVNYMSNDKWG
jgi:hypothetical protein